MKKDITITKDMTVSSVLKLDKNLGEVFMGFGMFCIFCHLSEDETIEEACQVHEIDTDFLVEKLNEMYNKKRKTKKEIK